MFTKEITQIGNALGLEGEFCKEFGFSQIMEAIEGPPPEVEEFEVERFLVFYPDGSVSHALTREGVQGFDCMGGSVERVARTFYRPKPKPVKRSVSVEAAIGTTTGQYMPGACRFAMNPDKSAFHAQPACHGKVGKLTFTWTD